MAVLRRVPWGALVILVHKQPEYADFDRDVRQRGRAFLAKTPKPTSQDFKPHHYWKDARSHLHRAYRGLCAYTASYLVESSSVDHFVPKSVSPNLAYEWDNFRLASPRVNSHKGDSVDIVDPFEIAADWFHLDLPSCLVVPAPGLDHALRGKVGRTIRVLKLNGDDQLVEARCEALLFFAREEVTLAFLDARYPFLAHEVRRQGMSPADLARIFRIA